MASTHSESIKRLYQGWVDEMAKNPEMTLDEMRDLFGHWGDITAEPDGVVYEEVNADGVSAMWAIPKDCARDRVVICTHGGGYVVGSMHSHRKMFGHIAKEIGIKALILNYRCAPEYPHPAPVEDAVTAYKWLLSQEIEPTNICTTGDSAGGGLCTSMLLSIRDNHLPMPAACMPISPWYDMEILGSTIQSNAAVDILVQDGILNSMAEMFLGGQNSPLDPLANPLQGDLAELPPIFIQVGGDECLLDDSIRFAQKAKDAGTSVELEIVPEMQHVFHFMAGNAPEADAAISNMATWVRPKLGLA